MSERFCIFVDETMATPNGYVPAVVYENESGYYPLMGRGEFGQPWYWGTDVSVAKRLAEDYNRKLGLSEDDVLDIITSSMAASGREESARERWQEIKGTKTHDFRDILDGLAKQLGGVPDASDTPVRP